MIDILLKCIASGPRKKNLLRHKMGGLFGSWNNFGTVPESMDGMPYLLHVPGGTMNKFEKINQKINKILSIWNNNDHILFVTDKNIF